MTKENKHDWRIAGVPDEGQWSAKFKLRCADCGKTVESHVTVEQIVQAFRDLEMLPKNPEKCWEEEEKPKTYKYRCRKGLGDFETEKKVFPMYGCKLCGICTPILLEGEKENE